MTDNQGATDTATATITVAQPGTRSRRSTPTPGTGPGPLTVQFDGTASSDANGTIASYAWDFGDGATSVRPQPEAHLRASAPTP